MRAKYIVFSCWLALLGLTLTFQMVSASTETGPFEEAGLVPPASASEAGLIAPLPQLRSFARIHGYGGSCRSRW
jgi:hypothetical protein